MIGFHEFENEWNVPHSLRAVDEKYVCMECPKVVDLHTSITRNFIAWY